MTERPSYQKTLFDRRGPDAANYIKAYVYGAIAGAVSAAVFPLIADKMGLRGWPAVLVVVLGPVAKRLAP